MAVIRFRCSDDLAAQIESASKARSLSVSDFCRALLTRVLVAQEAPAPADAERVDSEVYEARTKRLTMQLTPSEHAGVVSRATAMGMKPYSWIMRLLRAHLTSMPQFNDDEFRALREATGELSYIGRNLNQLVRAVNLNMNSLDASSARDVAVKVSEAVSREQDLIKALLDQNLNRWGVEK